MRLEQSFTLAAEPARVWEAFHDVRLMVDCLPGASLQAPDDAPIAPGADIPLLFKVRLGPIAAGFAGRGQLALDEAAQRGAFSGNAVDAKTNSRVKGQARFAVQPDGAGTRVALDVEFSVTGALAQFSREGIVRALAEQLTAQFAGNLQARLPQAAATARPAAGDDAGAPPAPVAAAPSAAPGQRPAAPDSAIDLWSLLVLWFRGLFARRR